MKKYKANVQYRDILKSIKYDIFLNNANEMLFWFSTFALYCLLGLFRLNQMATTDFTTRIYDYFFLSGTLLLNIFLLKSVYNFSYFTSGNASFFDKTRLFFIEGIRFVTVFKKQDPLQQ